jgi:hypothetical protein
MIKHDNHASMCPHMHWICITSVRTWCTTALITSLLGHGHGVPTKSLCRIAHGCHAIHIIMVHWHLIISPKYTTSCGHTQSFTIPHHLVLTPVHCCRSITSLPTQHINHVPTTVPTISSLLPSVCSRPRCVNHSHGVWPHQPYPCNHRVPTEPIAHRFTTYVLSHHPYHHDALTGIQSGHCATSNQTNKSH